MTHQYIEIKIKELEKRIEALEQEPCKTIHGSTYGGASWGGTYKSQQPSEDAIRRQDVLDLAKKGVLVSNGNYESVCRAINELPPVNPQEPITDRIEYGTDGNAYKMWMSNNIEQEPCSDAVSRQMVKEQMIKYGFHAPDMTVTEFVEDLPSVNLQESKTGHWVHNEYCSECGCDVPAYTIDYKFRSTVTNTL